MNSLDFRDSRERLLVTIMHCHVNACIRLLPLGPQLISSAKSNRTWLRLHEGLVYPRTYYTTNYIQCSLAVYEGDLWLLDVSVSLSYPYSSSLSLSLSLSFSLAGLILRESPVCTHIGSCSTTATIQFFFSDCCLYFLHVVQQDSIPLSL